MSSIFERYQQIRSRIDAAAVEAKRQPGEIMLLAVSKTFPASLIAELHAHGVRDFGESRVNELAEKAAQLPQDIIWHFIGRLQSNKVRKVVQFCDVIHSVDSPELLERIDRIAGEEGKTPEFLLEVNVSGEASKGGLRPDELPEAAAIAAKCTSAVWKGLMTMAPIDADDDFLNEIFSTLADLKRDCEERFNLELPELSMGMSGDFPIAIACGASIVRVGSRIFEGAV